VELFFESGSYTYLVTRINDLEQQLSAGLIEEVIQVAEGENKLIDTLYQNKV